MIKAIVLDMDGVLRIGDRPIPDANKFLSLLNCEHIPYMISTNECRYTCDELRNDLSEMEIDVPSSVPIYTAGMAVRDYLAKLLTKRQDQQYCVGIIGERGLIEVINELTEQYPNIRLSKFPDKR